MLYSKTLRRKSIRYLNNTGKLQILIISLSLLFFLCFIYNNYQRSLNFAKEDEKYVNEFLQMLAERRKNETIRARAMKFKAFRVSGDNLYPGQHQLSVPVIMDFFSKPESIFKEKFLGEGGLPVRLPGKIPVRVAKIIQRGYEHHQFNQYVSDLISVRRSLPDKRSPQCKIVRQKYPKKLPTTSVIIIFHNEAWSTLLRTVHSVLDRSPAHLIKEIILVDDFSTYEYLKDALDKYTRLLPKVKIIRAKSRLGIVKARIKGALAARGSTLTFLDSHVECTEGWLEPLVERVKKFPHAIVTPLIDRIHDDTLEYITQSYLEKIHVGGFSWSLNFEWFPLSKSKMKARHDPTDPVKTPAMAGGLFTIDRNYFKKLGMYDPNYQIWGSENLELSFKTWMCGGKIEIIPCSRVAHVFRYKSPFNIRDSTIINNKRRLAAAWLDEYSKHFQLASGIKMKPVDVTGELKLREKLSCKSFSWYLRNIYPELILPENMLAYGEIKSFDHHKCLSARSANREQVKAGTCTQRGGNQYWEFNNGIIGKGNYYLTFDKNSTLILRKLKPTVKPTTWYYYKETSQIGLYEVAKCLQLNSNYKLSLEDCDKPDSPKNQQWILQHANEALFLSSEEDSEETTEKK